MAQPYSVQMAAGNFPNNGLVYTVPDAKVAVLRSITIYVETSGDLGALGLTSAGPWIVVRTSGTPNGSIEWYGRHVLNAGQQLYLVCGGPSAFVVVSGYLLSVA